MSFLRLPLAALAWIGRQGTTGLAVSIFLGIAVPPLAAYVKPHLGETVFVLLVFSYLRTEPDKLRQVVRAPGLAMAGALWAMIAVPLLAGGALVLIGLPKLAPDLYTIMILHLAIAPIVSSAAFAALMGLDVAFTMVAVILSIILSPVTTVATSYLFLGGSLISPLDLGIKLLVFLLVSGLVAMVIRRIAGQERSDAHKETIDGLNVLAVFVFAIAAMDGVPRHVMADPLGSAALLGIAVLLALGTYGLGAIAFIRAGFRVGAVVGMLSAFRNLGTIMAAIGTTLPDQAWFYFALVQFPIYLFPALLKPIVRRQSKSPP